MRFGTVGTGWICKAMTEAMARSETGEWWAAYSRDLSRAQEFAPEEIVCFDSLEEMADCSEIEAVYLASPNVCHFAQCRLFLEHGKHVLCEKPLTVTAGQARELLELAEEKGVLLLEAIMNMYLPQYRFLEHAVGKIGRITSAHLDFSQLSSKYGQLKAGELPNIFNPAMGTGCLMDLGVYNVNLAVRLFGVPENVKAAATFLASGADAAGSAILEYADKTVTLTYSKTGQSSARSQILGDEGTVTVESISRLQGIRLHSGGVDRILYGWDKTHEDSMLPELEAFCQMAEDPKRYAQRIALYRRLMLDTAEVMERIRAESGITFPGETQ